MTAEKKTTNNSSNVKWYCEKLKDQIPKQLYKIMLVVFMGIFALTIFVSNYNTASVLVYAMLSTFVVAKFTKKYKGCFDTTTDKKLLLVLSLVCFIIKFLWVYFMRMEPKVDYLTFYNTAVALSESWHYSDRYIALFPHIFGYSTFLSLFIKVFGESVFLATVLNVILSVISGILIYKIIKNFISTTAGVCAYTLWIICPSQTIFNSLVFSEPLYTTLILAFVYFVTVIAKKEEKFNWFKMLTFGVLAAVILQCINVNRPIAMVMIIAMFIWIFVLRFKELFQKEFLVKWISFFTALLVVYFSLGSLWNLCFTSRMGEAPASVPGYNIHVGFNAKSSGAWNKEDSDLLFSYSNQEGVTADWAQKQMLNEAKKRITSGEIDFSKLFKEKLSFFLGKDSVCVGYCSDIIQEKEDMSMVCDTFYYCMILLSLYGAYKMLKLSHKSPTFILPLFVIGITCAQMLVEVAPRYHYSIVPFLIMMSQFYLFETKSNSKRTQEDK